jgi:hypothetical protein
MITICAQLFHMSTAIHKLPNRTVWRALANGTRKSHGLFVHRRERWNFFRFCTAHACRRACSTHI